MPLRVRSAQDFAASLAFLGFGAVGLAVGSGYPMGTASRMGPGYFPVLLSGLLLLLGLAILARSVRFDGPAIENVGWRPLFFICAAVFAFGWVIDRFGLVPAVVVVTALMALASPERRWGEIALSALAMSAFCTGVFIYGLGQPLKILAW